MKFNAPALLWVLICVFLWTYVLEAPLRYVLFLLHLSPLLYLRDGIMVMIVAGFVIASAKKLRISPATIPWLIVISVSSITAMAFSPTINLWIMGLKIILPMLVGFLCYRYCEARLWNTSLSITLMAIVALVGLGVNYFLSFPWDNLNYSIGNMQIQGVYNWTMIEVLHRLNGFANGPQKIADQILVVGLYFFLKCKKSPARFALWGVFLGALLLTTVKTVIASWVIIGIARMIYSLKGLGRLAVRWSLIVPLVLAITLPIFSIKNETSLGGTETVIQDMLFGSMLTRLGSTWPQGFKLILDQGSPVFGRGLGTMGGGQMYFEPDQFNPGDNLFLYLYGNLGILGTLVIPWIFWRVVRRSPERTFSDRYWLFFALSFFIIGITSHGIEDGFMAMFYGFLLGHLCRRRSVSERASETERGPSVPALLLEKQ